MGSSSVHHGYATFSVDGEEPVKFGNRTHPFNHTHVFEAYVRTGRWAGLCRLGATIHFRRHSAKRPYVQNLRHRGAWLDYPNQHSRSWEGAVSHDGALGSGPDGASGSTMTSRVDQLSNWSRDFGRNYQLANTPAAIGTFNIHWDPSFSAQLAQAANEATGNWGKEALSEVDIPRTTIGNIFKHPINRAAWFNETLIVPLSQGQIQITGAYNPPDDQLTHRGFMVYYTKGGGTGVISGAVKTTGSTASGTPARFTDTTFAGFVVGDVGKYIAIHGRGIYLITAFVDASNVDTDAVTINEGFTTQSGLTWTLRTGPIAEYFWRTRPYFKGNAITNALNGDSNVLSGNALDERLQTTRTGNTFVAQRVVYDGYGHWWWTIPNQTDKPYGLIRWLHQSPQPFQDVLNDGSMTGLTQSTWGATATAPAGIWGDIIRDQNKKLWFSCQAGQNDRFVLARMDPAPGGNAAAPAVEAVWRKQQSASDAGGLTSRDIIALCDDRSGVYSGGGGTHRIWAIGGNGESATGGLSYSDDDGTTWKRVHQLSAATGTATATNGSTAVTGSGTTFDTQFAAGDWIRFGSDTRSYEIASIADALNLTLASNYQGSTGGGKSLQKGALAANQAVCRTGYSYSDAGASYADGQHSLDWDTNGNVYWISHSGQICRWKPSDGACVSFAQTAIPAVSPLTAISASAPVTNLTVVRVPNVAGSGVHPFHNEVWLGCSYNGDDNSGGWIRVRGDQTWTATPTATNFTRYHYHNSITTNFPSIVKVPKDGTFQFFTRNTSIRVDPATGKIMLHSSYGEGTPGWNQLRMTGSETNLEYWSAEQTMIYAHATGRASQTQEPWRRAVFDEDGMGMLCVISPQDANAINEVTESVATLGAPSWVDWRWDGSAWRRGLLAGNWTHDLNMRGGTNGRTQAAVLGAGFRRVHEWAEPLGDGLYVSFLQAGGAVAQADEFIVDETSTFVCALGAMKDNTQTANIYYQMFAQPTVQRLCDEAVKTIKNLNTSDGGYEGGFSTSISGSLTFRQPFVRGAADHFKYPVGGGLAANYLATNNTTINNTTACAPMAVLRVKPSVDLNSDGSWTGGTDLFNTAGGYTFTIGDVGKSIFIEGANGGTIDPDNGQAVILEHISATQVRVDKVFTTTRTAAAGLRWKLKDIPAVAFVEVGFAPTNMSYVKTFWRHDLWSSMDHGVNWSLVKYSGEGTNSIPLNGPDDVSPGTWYSHHNGYKLNVSTTQSDNDPNVGCSVIFDLRDLPENVRRRQYWRWRCYDPNADAPRNNTFFAGIHVYDANFKPLGRPAENKLGDADDAEFGGCQVDKIQDIRASGTGAAPADDGNADGLTNIVNVTGPLYLDTGTNDAQVTSAGRFIDAGAAFTRLSVGRFIRIAGAVNSANNGWALITGFVSATEVQTSKVFVDETNTFSWATCAFGPNDELRIDSASIPPTIGVALEDVYFTIADVPTTSQIVVTQVQVPHPITAAAWDVGRNLNHTQVHDSSLADWDINSRVAFGHIDGTLHFGYDLEFVTVQTSTVSATTPADDDGDGCTDIIVMAENLTTVDGPVVGDFIEISHATYGQRILEIIDITGSDPNKNIRVAYDEVLPGIASGLTWTIRRRRDLQQQVRRVTIVGNGVPVT